LKSNTIILEKQEQQVKLSKLDTYTNLSNSELIEGIKCLIKKANAIEGLDSKPAREILMEDRR